MARTRQTDPRTVKVLDVLTGNPTLTVPQAMRVAGFSIEESRCRNKQMWIRRSIPSKKSMIAAKASSALETEPTDASFSLSAAVSATDVSSLNNSVNGDFSAKDDQFQYKLQDWISFQRLDVENQDSSVPMGTSSMQKNYLEQSVQILHSLAGKIVCGVGSGGKLLHPDFITVENIIVCESSAMLGHDDSGQLLSGYFTRSGSSSPSLHSEINEDGIENMHAAMHAFARIAYEMCTMGIGPSFPAVPPRTVTSSETDMSISLSLKDVNGGAGGTDDDDDDEEEELLDMMRKSFRVTETKDSSNAEFMSAMDDAGIPLPMKRFIVDLMGDEHAGIFRSEHSFTSFEDVVSDLKQMMDNPDEFLHGSVPVKWKLDFGDKLYGRGAEMDALMNAANRVVSDETDPLLSRVVRSNLKKTEVVMVSGSPGAGKSRLVRLGGTQLEKRGWCFLQCKFDRVAHPEPLSTLAHAFDEYFGRFLHCPKHHGSDKSTATATANSHCSCRSQQLHDRLTSLISPEDLEILAMYIPSLRRFLDLALVAVPPDVNETLMASLFGALLLAMSSKDTPIFFFLDDLQWADQLSLSMLEAFAKATHCGSFHLSSANRPSKSGLIDAEKDTYIMLVGSYREQAVNDNQLFAKALRDFHQDVQDNSKNLTSISLSGMTTDTLNEMLSETLSLPKRRVRPLSKLVIQKTDGLPLFVIEFIRALAVDNLLTHNFTRGWEWDADSIEIFPITESVAELFALKLRRLPKDILLGLQIVSCFGCQVDEHVLRLVHHYDGDNSVDIPAALNIALNEGLVERAAHFFSFAHDLIQKATIDSIREDDLVPLLRKLIAALAAKASQPDSRESVLFVVVDLINRIGSMTTFLEHERALFAELNLRAGTKAVAVPDFAGAAMYAENGIALLRDTCWRTQYDLSLQLHEIAVLSHFSNRTGDQTQLMKRINTVFEHARNFSDKFNTHRIWTRLLSLSNFPRAIEESLRALEQLGDPLNLSYIDNIRVRKELEKQKERFSGDSETMLAQLLEDQNKKNAMKIMTSLMLYYSSRKSCLGAFISCRMIEITVKYGYCEDSIVGVAGFAASLVSSLGDIDGGSTWGRKAMALMKLCGKKSLIPAVYFALYGTVFVWKDPIQSTLDSLAEGIRSSFAYGNVEFAVVNTYVYISRSYQSGKNIRVLTEEVEALARQHGIRVDDSDEEYFGDTPELLQLYMRPMYNILRVLQEDDVHSCRGRLVMNYDLLKIATEKEQFSCFHALLTNQIATEFMLRNMDCALKCTEMYFEHFEARKLQLMYTIFNYVFYDGLINFYYMGQTGNTCYLERGEMALSKMKEWLRHSDWNFKSKLLLMQAEYYKVMKDVNKAAICYEASISTAMEHKFIHEEAMGNELAGIFHLELGSRQRSYSYLKQSMVCYQKWGAPAIVRRIEAMIANEFRMDIMQVVPNEIAISSVVAPIPSKKRQFS
ncbi:hypothetical protein ACHAXH_004516 [Discostella pseudostelligera]